MIKTGEQYRDSCHANREVSTRVRTMNVVCARSMA